MNLAVPYGKNNYDLTHALIFYLKTLSIYESTMSEVYVKNTWGRLCHTLDLRVTFSRARTLPKLPEIESICMLVHSNSHSLAQLPMTAEICPKQYLSVTPVGRRDGSLL